MDFATIFCFLKYTKYLHKIYIFMLALERPVFNMPSLIRWVLAIYLVCLGMDSIIRDQTKCWHQETSLLLSHCRVTFVISDWDSLWDKSEYGCICGNETQREFHILNGHPAYFFCYMVESAAAVSTPYYGGGAYEHHFILLVNVL
jgi:hypothetical protein